MEFSAIPLFFIERAGDGLQHEYNAGLKVSFPHIGSSRFGLSHQRTHWRYVKDVRRFDGQTGEIFFPTFLEFQTVGLLYTYTFDAIPFAILANYILAGFYSDREDYVASEQYVDLAWRTTPVHHFTLGLSRSFNSVDTFSRGRPGYGFGITYTLIHEILVLSEISIGVHYYLQPGHFRALLGADF